MLPSSSLSDCARWYSGTSSRGFFAFGEALFEEAPRFMSLSEDGVESEAEDEKEREFFLDNNGGLEAVM